MHKAHTPEDYRATRNEVAKTNAGRWRLITREMFYSFAFVALDKGGILTVLTVMDKLRYEKKGKDRKGVKTDQLTLKDNGEFTLSINELRSYGISKSSAMRGRNQAWELGFFDVIEPGTVHHIGRYRYSERWKLYPQGDYRPKDQSPPGKNVYPLNNFGSDRQKMSDEDSEETDTNDGSVPVSILLQ